MQDILLSTNFITTFCVFVACASAIVGLILYERKPRQSLNPKMLPSMPLLMVIGIVALLMLVHLVNLLGIHTGR